jgi:hypothetical protein
MAVATALVSHVHGGDDRQKFKAVTTALVFRAHSAEANVGWVIGFLVSSRSDRVATPRRHLGS